MTHPATVESLEEGSVGEGNHRWVVCTEEILEPKPITSPARRRPSIYTSYDACTDHHVRRVSVIQRRCTAGNVCYDAPTYNQHRLISGCTVLL